MVLVYFLAVFCELYKSSQVWAPLTFMTATDSIEQFLGLELEWNPSILHVQHVNVKDEEKGNE